MAKGTSVTATKGTKGKAAKSAPSTLPQGTRRIGDLADELSVNYLKARDLFDAETTFTLVAASERTSNKFGHAEVVFEIITADGENGFLSMKSSARRVKLVQAVNRGPIGPLMMAQGEDDSQGNAPWCFVDPATPDEKF